MCLPRHGEGERHARKDGRGGETCGRQNCIWLTPMETTPAVTRDAASCNAAIAGGGEQPLVLHLRGRRTAEQTKPWGGAGGTGLSARQAHRIELRLEHDVSGLAVPNRYQGSRQRGPSAVPGEGPRDTRRSRERCTRVRIVRGRKGGREGGRREGGDRNESWFARERVLSYVDTLCRYAQACTTTHKKCRFRSCTGHSPRLLQDPSCMRDKQRPDAPPPKQTRHAVVTAIRSLVAGTQLSGQTTQHETQRRKEKGPEGQRYLPCNGENPEQRTNKHTRRYAENTGKQKTKTKRETQKHEEKDDRAHKRRPARPKRPKSVR